METVKLILGIILLVTVFIVLIIWLTTKLEKIRNERVERLRADIVKAELAELAKWGVSSDEVHVIQGRITMSIMGLMKLVENQDYLAHLEKESLALNLHKDFFKEQLLNRVEIGKKRIQEKIEKLRTEGKDVSLEEKLKQLGLK